MRQKNFAHHLQCAVLACILLCSAAGCGGGNPVTAHEEAPASLELAQALSALDATPTPSGVTPETFTQLKAELRRLLMARELQRFASQAPTSGRSQVLDLHYNALGSTGPVLAWTYKSEGDFDQNGIVGIPDLAQIGMHFGKDSTAADWASAQLADGNQNGKIELGDVVSIAANYTYRTQGYNLEYSATGEETGAWDNVDEVPFASSSTSPGPYRLFSCDATALAAGFYRVMPFDSTTTGIASTTCQISQAGHFETENNDTWQEADVLPSDSFTGDNINGNLGSGNDDLDDDGDNVDWFQLNVTHGGYFEIQLVFDDTANLDMYLYQDPEAEPLGASEIPVGKLEYLNLLLPQGTYYIKCLNLSGYTEYYLKSESYPIDHFETEDNDSFESADELPTLTQIDQTFNGNLGAGNFLGDDDGDSVDWYTFTSLYCGDLTINYAHIPLLTTGITTQISLYRDPTGEPLVVSQVYVSRVIQHYLELPGTYFIKCEAISSNTEYSMSIQFDPDMSNHQPIAKLLADQTVGSSPMLVNFDASGSYDFDLGDSIVKYEYDFGEGAGYEDLGTLATTSHTYNTPGDYTAKLRVTDSGGLIDEDELLINVEADGAGVWNVLVWMAADNNLADEAYGDIQRLEVYGSTANVRVLVGYDISTSWLTQGLGCDAVHFIKVVQDSNPLDINVIGDPLNLSFPKVGYDSSHPQNIVNFLEWAAQFPSDHTLLILWDHGNGWRQGWKDASAAGGGGHGVSALLKDDFDGTADLTNNEWLVNSLAAYHFDVLMLDACNMGHLEAISDYASMADWIVSSEVLLWSGGMPYDQILSDWNAAYPLGARFIGELIVQKCFDQYQEVKLFSMSVVDSAEVPGLVSQVAGVATSVKSSLTTESLPFKRAMSYATELRAGDGERDLRHFLAMYGDMAVNAEVKAQAASALAQADAAIKFFRADGIPGTSGISVFLPTSRYFDPATTAEYAATPFNTGTGWLDMLSLTGVPLQSGAPALEGPWVAGDKLVVTWSNSLAEVDVCVQNSTGFWASAVYPSALNATVAFSADNPGAGGTSETAELLPTGLAGDYIVRLDWFAYNGPSAPATLPVAVQLQDADGNLKQDFGTVTLIPNSAAHTVKLVK